MFSQESTGFLIAYLFDIVEKWKPWHVEGERCILQGQVEKGEGCPQAHQHLFQEGGVAWEVPQSVPEPVELSQDGGEKDGLEANPHFGETAVLWSSIKGMVTNMHFSCLPFSW